MVVALIGIILIQLQWIDNAIKDKEAEYTSRANDALNDVNEDIVEHEAMFFVNQLGGLDSLMGDIEFIDDSAHHRIIVGGNTETVIHHENDDDKNVIRISMTTDEGFDNVKEIIHSIPNEEDELIQILELEELAQLGEELEEKLGEIKITVKETIENTEEVEAKMDIIESRVKHFTFENILSDEHLRQRISKDELNERIKEAFEKHGLNSNYDFAVYNKDKEAIEEDYSSDNFDEDGDKIIVKKKLFPEDLSDHNEYELAVQLNDQSNFVWSEVKSMIFTSTLFTLLILLCFGYSVYYIFKQKKISQVKNDFINNMTHELKTPLASISLAADSIKHPRVIGNEQEVDHFITIIKNEERRMNNHIEKVLEIARLDKGELQLQKENIDFIPLIHKAIEQANLRLTSANGTIHFDSKLSSAVVNGDAFHLANTLNNILDNSIKYRRNDLSIHVRLSEKASGFEITIIDNGIGINKKTARQAFDKFYREEGGNIHTVKGFGLGLSYVKSIVNAHGGTVEIDGSPNKGTTVKMTIPKA